MEYPSFSPQRCIAAEIFRDTDIRSIQEESSTVKLPGSTLYLQLR